MGVYYYEGRSGIAQFMRATKKIKNRPVTDTHVIDAKPFHYVLFVRSST